MAAKRASSAYGGIGIALVAVLQATAFTTSATAERIWSAVIFGTFGFFWLAAYWSARRDPSD